MRVDVTWATAWVRGSARTVFEHRVELIELDRQIGDGDHGENLARGFTAVLARLDALETAPGDIGEVLRLVATTLMSTVGGAAGPLYGTAYLRAAKVTGFPELDSAGVVAMLEAGLEGIVVRGKASPGEKTMSMRGPQRLPQRSRLPQRARSLMVCSPQQRRPPRRVPWRPSPCWRRRAARATSASGRSATRTRARPRAR